VKKLKEIIIFVLNLPIYWISFFVPKNKYLWVFGAWNGDKFSDNTRYLFEYVNKKHPEIHAIWLTKNREVLKLIKKKGYRAYLTYSLKGYLISMNAKLGIVSHLISDINRFTCCRMKIIHLWHGHAVKPIFCMDKDKTRKKEFLLKKKLSYIFPFLNRDINFNNAMITTLSDKTKSIFSQAFNNENIVVTGCPRNDGLFINNCSKFEIYNLLLNYRKHGFKLGIYMPTYRKNIDFDIVNYFTQNSDIITMRLKELKVILAIKLHPFNFKKFFIKKYDDNIERNNILKIKDGEIEQDIYSILPVFDFLITDYSSIFIDYLLLERPIIFAPFDKDQFFKINGNLLYNYNEVTPGPKAKNWDEVLKYIEEVINNPNKYKKERESVRNIFHKYVDNNSCKRVYNAIIEEVF